MYLGEFLPLLRSFKAKNALLVLGRLINPLYDRFLVFREKKIQFM